MRRMIQSLRKQICIIARPRDLQQSSMRIMNKIMKETQRDPLRTPQVRELAAVPSGTASWGFRQ